MIPDFETRAVSEQHSATLGELPAKDVTPALFEQKPRSQRLPNPRLGHPLAEGLWGSCLACLYLSCKQGTATAPQGDCEAHMGSLCLAE